MAVSGENMENRLQTDRELCPDPLTMPLIWRVTFLSLIPIYFQYNPVHSTKGLLRKTILREQVL